MGEYTQVTFAFARGVGLTSQSRAEQTLVPRERAFRLPTLPVHTLRPAAAPLLAEPPHHLPPVARLGSLPPTVATIQRNYRRADAQVLPAVAVALLAVERRVAEHSVVNDRYRCLGHDGAELRGVVGGAEAGPRRGEEVASRIADHG